MTTIYDNGKHCVPIVGFSLLVPSKGTKGTGREEVREREVEGKEVVKKKKEKTKREGEGSITTCLDCQSTIVFNKVTVELVIGVAEAV